MIKSSPNIVGLKAYFELIRPFTLLAPAVGFLSGTIIASGSFPGIYGWLGALSAVLLNAASNVFNQYFDIEIDKINKPERPLPCGKISKRIAIRVAILLYLLSLMLSVWINLEFCIIILSAAIISVFYSLPGIRIKKYPFISNIFIAIARGMLLIVAGWSLHRSVFNIQPWFIGSIFALYLFGASSTKDFSDVKGDRQFGVTTLPILFGPEKSARIIAPFFYFPFMLIPLGIVFNLIRLTSLPLTLLAVWGFYTANLIIKRPLDLTLEGNHISWKHMYLILIFGQIGFAIAYLF